MFPRSFSLRQMPTARTAIFEDQSGSRRGRILGLVGLCVVLTFAWAATFLAMTVLPSRHAHPVATARFAATGDSLTDAVPVLSAPTSADGVFPPKVQKVSTATGNEDHATVSEGTVSSCRSPRSPFGAAFAASPKAGARRVFAILPNEPVQSFLSLERNCDRISVLLPEWLEIGGPGLVLSRIDLDAEMAQEVKAILRDRSAAPLLMPVVNLAYTVTANRFAARLADAAYRQTLVRSISAAMSKIEAQGVCLRFSDFKLAQAGALVPLLDDLRRDLALSGRTLCLISSVENDLWKSPDVVARVNQFVVTAFKEPWRGTPPGPLSPAPWFAQQMTQVAARIGTEKLVVALGSYAVDWVSGRSIPERIGFSEAVYRASTAGVDVRFSPDALNSTLGYVDDKGLRHRIWMLDAPSFANSLKVLDDLGIVNVGVATLGEEDPSLWALLDADPAAPVETLLRTVALPDYVAYRGKGPFYRLAATGRIGERDLVRDPGTGLITGQTWRALPQPYQMERFGAVAPLQIALTFDDGPDQTATSRILDILKEQRAPATFFVVGRSAIQAPDVLRRAVAEGHMIGSHTFFHPRMEDASPVVALSELNGLKNLVEGVTGRTPRLYRAPYVRGPGPLTGHVAAGFTLLAQEGYVVAGSDIVPPDWTGISATAIVKRVLDELEHNGGNVIVLHDGRSEGMHTAEALATLIPALRALGYQIVPLSTLLGTTDAALLPPVGWAAGVFNAVSFGALSGAVWMVIALFWITLLAGFLRAAIYLILARRRQPVHVRLKLDLPSVTVVIPAYNEEVVILQTIVNVLQSDYPGLKVIMVDDGSKDRTLQIVQAHYAGHPQVRILSQSNQGKWQALNTAFSQIDTEIAVCVDADTRIARDAIRALVQPFAESTVGAVAGTVVVGNRINLLTRSQAVEYICAQQIARRAQEHLNGILVVPGAIGAWRVDAVKNDLGYFSNDTLTEDADLTIMMRRGGYRVAYAEHAIAYTEVPSDVRSFMKQRLRWSLGNLQSLWKHRSAFGELSTARMFTMCDMILFGYLLPLVAPIMDALFLFFVIWIGVTAYNGGDLSGLHLPRYAVIAFLGVPLVDLLVAWAALRYDRREPMSLLIVVPVMNFYFRQLLYVTVYRVLWSALTGRLASWNKLRRLGMHGRTAGATHEAA